MTESKISIYRDGTWAGDGVIEDGTIADCAAELGATPEESEETYEAIEAAIAAGEEAVQRGDGVYTWRVTPAKISRIIRQTGGSVEVGAGYVYDFITRNAAGRLRLFLQQCRVNDDGYVEAGHDPIDHTDSVDGETLAAWAAEWGLHERDGDPRDCIVAPGEMLVGHRLMRDVESDR